MQLRDACRSLTCRNAPMPHFLVRRFVLGVGGRGCGMNARADSPVLVVMLMGKVDAQPENIRNPLHP